MPRPSRSGPGPKRSALPRIVAACGCALALGALACGPSEPGFVEELVRAERAGEDTLLLSSVEPEADLERAYEVQRAFVDQRFGNGKIGGYKAGLATAAAQERFGLREPIAGVLPALGRLEGAPSLDPSGFRRLWVEIEFAFELGKDVLSPVRDRAGVRELVAALRPAVELPDVGFEGLENLKMVDLVASNVAGSYLLVGPGVDPDSVDLASLEVRLRRDAELLVEARAESIGLDAWESIRWLINDRLARGWPLRAGQILIAGALAAPEMGVPGHYEADFGTLGVLRFEVTATE